ncbi:uncharacterized protein CIMG_12984 [Coccidioides immitis RS]|uniref:Uncharacterized protein n=1 Tax=Coccidioides immitis (strain RS) TaxID=246410 RepID=J3K6S7_COCIM|nr:uncharacterized protein CIMG_12984 [Coccidioides immitis RS]EAS30312.3 hypothetical protein CIMG_12984 [Coccidioides immitis RS]
MFDFNQYIQITEVNKFTTSNLQKKWETTRSVIILQLICWWNDRLQGATMTVLTQINGEYNIPNHAWKLISYPYYTKYAKSGDKTGFHHIDVNVPDAITTGRGINMIQEFLTLTAEEPGNCTEILPEMHNHLENLWKLVKEQDLFTDDYVHHIKNTIYTKDNKRKFGIRWTNIIYKSGDVQITSSLLLYGAYDPCKKVWHTILLWYMAIQKDHEHLEVNEAVIEKLNTLFGPEEKKAQNFINNWHLKAM